jgi:hypothetical protein
MRAELAPNQVEKTIRRGQRDRCRDCCDGPDRGMRRRGRDAEAEQDKRSNERGFHAV